MQITIKLEGIENVSKLFNEKGDKVIAGAEKVISKHMGIILNSAKGKIHNISGETAATLKAKVDGKGKTFVVAQIGTLGATAEEAIRANSLEYGHASPGNSRGPKTTPPHPFIRPAVDENKNAFKNDMKAEIKRVIEG